MLRVHPVLIAVIALAAGTGLVHARPDLTGDNLWGGRSLPAPRASSNSPRELAAKIDALGRVFGDGASISVRDIDSNWSVGYGADRLCPQQSVSKFWVALTTFDAIDRGKVAMDDKIILTREDLTLFHQPIRALVGANGYTTTVRELLERAMTESDNTANDALLRHVGGPGAIRSMLSRKDIDHVRFGPGERLLQSGIAGITWKQAFAAGNGFYQARAAIPLERRQAAIDAYTTDPVDGAAPAAITGALGKLVKGDLLSEQSTRDLIALMERSKTGRARLKSAVEPGWTLAHKTGTGQQLGALTAGFNDVGLMIAPDGRRYAVAVMIARSDRPIAERQRLIADVARAVIDNWKVSNGFAARTMPSGAGRP